MKLYWTQKTVRMNGSEAISKQLFWRGVSQFSGHIWTKKKLEISSVWNLLREVPYHHIKFGQHLRNNVEMYTEQTHSSLWIYRHCAIIWEIPSHQWAACIWLFCGFTVCTHVYLYITFLQYRLFSGFKTFPYDEQMGSKHGWEWSIWKFILLVVILDTQ
jgi:hypothetical protein